MERTWSAYQQRDGSKRSLIYSPDWALLEQFAKVLPAVEAQGIGRAFMLGHLRQCGAELGGEQFAEHVVVVVDWRDREMRLGRPVRFVAVGRRSELLVPGHIELST